MKLKITAVNSLIYFLYFFGACFVTMLAESLLLKIIDNFAIISYFAQSIVRVIVYTLAVPAIIALLGYFEGYRDADGNTVSTAISCALALVWHVLFAMLFNFQAFVTGGVRFMAGLIHNGSSITYESMIEKTPYSLFLIMFLAYGVLYGALIVGFKYYGAKKRMQSRRELMGQ